MRVAYSVSKVRAAEAALMALVPDGALMQRAAAGLASVCAGLLRDGAGGVYGARVVILAGTGDNGGDALYAGERLARRGASVTAIQAGPRLHEDGARALTAAGGRVIPVAPPRDPDATRDDLAGPPDAAEHAAAMAATTLGYEVRRAIGHADLIIDGMLGIGGKGGSASRTRRSRSSPRTRGTPPPSRSTCHPASTPTPGSSPGPPSAPTSR